MSENFYNTLFLILRDFSLVLGATLVFVSLVVGVLLVFKPSVVINWNKKAGSTFSFRLSLRALDIPRYIDRVFYRHHKIIGTIVVFTSIYILYYFTQVFDAGVISSFMAGSAYLGFAEIIAKALQLFLLLTCVATLVIGIIMFIRPSLLKGFEDWSNRWISTPEVTKALFVERDHADQLAFRYPRLVGMAIILLSLYIAIGLIVLYI